jgi:hypothetical protein
MKKIVALFLLISILPAACAPQPAAPAETVIPVQTQPDIVVPTTAAEESAKHKTYTNEQFGLSFQYPASWFGPDEYFSDPILRVAVGSDVVQPYGGSPTEPTGVVNSYLVVLQYSQNDQNQYWKDNYQIVLNLQDGESLSDGRGLIIRVREIDLGRFKGFEYIATLSENAQSEASYSREVILVDEQSNLITVSGRPNNVEVPSGSAWRDIYKMIDEQNLAFFHDIVESITAQ